MSQPRQFNNDINLNRREVQNFAIEELAADPTGPDLYEGREWRNTTSNERKVYVNGVIETYIFRSELNQRNAFLGVYDATGGTFPTAANFPNAPGGDISAGDYIVIQQVGTSTLPNGSLSGSDDVKSGDELIALVDNPSTAADWAIINRNESETSSSAMLGEQQTVNLVQGTPLTVTAGSGISTILGAKFFDAGEEIDISSFNYSGNTFDLCSDARAISNLVVSIWGLA